MSPQANVTTTPTSNALAGLTPAQKAAYTSEVDAAQTAAQIEDNRRSANAAYLSNACELRALCPPAGGGITQAFASGSTLIYNLPTVAGAYARELIFTMNLTVNCAAGTGATYGLTAGNIYSLINEIDIEYNGKQARVKPIALKWYNQLRYRGGPTPGQVMSGYTGVSGINTALSSTLTVASGNNTWNLVFRMPLNALHRLSPYGMLPIMGNATRGQVSILLNSAALGPDPMLNAVYSTGGSGNAVTVTGTIKVECIYNDGSNFGSPNPMTLDINGPTCQYIIDTTLQNFTAGTVQRQHINSLLQHYYVLGNVIDGNQSNLFAAYSNIAILEFDKDSVGQNQFYQYGENNVSINDYWDMLRQTFGQDFDQGFIPWVVAESFNQENPDNRMGTMALNMTPGGWSDATLGYQVNTVNGLGTVTPRVEHYLISLNPQGLFRS